MATNDYEAELRAANEVVYKHSLELAQLKQELEAVNQKQESLLHFMGHEIKGYLTKSEAGFAAISEGDFGPITPELKNMACTALDDVRKGVDTVMQILDSSNLKKGTMSYNKTTFNIKDALEGVAKDLRVALNEKNLTFEEIISPDTDFVINGDEEKIRRHVFRNLIDNAIRYTPSGTIRVELSRADNMIHFKITDTGIGITPEDMKRLFTEGGHGKDSIKINVHSTGYGLFIAKQIVEAHGGKIWAVSEGTGKGSSFLFEIPVGDPAKPAR